MPKTFPRTTRNCPHCLRAEKRIQRLERTISKLTKSDSEERPKQLYFDEKHVAVRLGVSVKTLQNWRTLGKGPDFTKFGSAVRYRLRDIVAFERSLPTSRPA